MEGVRIDKWLWATRFFKTRGMAARACELGRIECNSQKAKPARQVRTRDQLLVKNNSGEFRVQVLAVSQMRGPAAAAQTLYAETEESKEARLRAAEERKAMLALEPLADGKLSKRGRR